MKIKRIAAFALTAVILSISTVSVKCDKPEGLDAEHVRDGYEPNEPLFVHTPVISPVSIRDEDGNDIPDSGKGTSVFAG